MIKILTEREPRIELNLLGSEGNAFFLLGTARNIARQLGWSENRTQTIMQEMASGDYENLVEVMEREFGQYVIMYR